MGIDTTISPTTAFVSAVLVAVIAQVLATRFKFPPILLWLTAGIVLGPYGLHWLHAEQIQPAMHTLVELGLAIILFEGGLNLNLKALRETGWVVGRLVILGPLITMFAGGAAAHWLAGMNWPLALLFGALISVGGPTVIMPIVRQMRLGRTISHILTGEAMLVDGIGAILAIVMLQVALTPDMPGSYILQDIFFKAAVGTAIGIAGGRLLAWLLSLDTLKDMELRTIMSLAAAWGLFLLADSISQQAGLLTMLVMGATLQRMELPDIQRLRHFKGSLSVLLISLLFVLLAANLNLLVIENYLWQGFGIFIILALFVRPLLALLATAGSGLEWKQTAYLAGMAPRGVVAAAITSLFALILQENGQVQSEMFLALVYIIIIVSVFTYSLGAAPLKRFLKIEGGNERSVLIIGGGQIGAEVGRALGEDREVRFLDLNADVVNNLQRSGYNAVRGNALDPLYMEILRAEEIGTALIMTGSSDHNLLIARMAREEFHIPNIFVAMQEGDESKHSRLLHQLQTRRLFSKPYTFTYWNDQAYRKRLVYETREVEEDSPLIGHRMADVRIPHGVLPICMVRKGQTCIPYDDLRFAAGDEIKMLMRPERIQEGQPLILPPPTDNSRVGLETKEA